jgi:XTP/dITP diphosphohydrolase
MKEQLIFATNNTHKLDEVRSLLGFSPRLLSLAEIGCREDLPETSPTLEGNALQKARFFYQHYRCDCFADDTGLEVRALNGAPGVYSARYAGPSQDAVANRRKLLQAMEGFADRSAQFRTVIAFIQEGKEYLFEGIVRGEIICEERGSAGFGYDSLFVPHGYSQTFAQLGIDIKNTISHRAEAIHRFKQFLNENR